VDRAIVLFHVVAGTIVLVVQVYSIVEISNIAAMIVGLSGEPQGKNVGQRNIDVSRKCTTSIVTESCRDIAVEFPSFRSIRRNQQRATSGVATKERALRSFEDLHGGNVIKGRVCAKGTLLNDIRKINAD